MDTVDVTVVIKVNVIFRNSRFYANKTNILKFYILFYVTLKNNILKRVQ